MNNHKSRNPPTGPQESGLSFNFLVAAGGIKYIRQLHLQHLLPLTPARIDDLSLQNCKWILSRLARALRQERNRGKSAHWAYSLNRHIALLQAYRGEQKYLENLKAKKPLSFQRVPLNRAPSRFAGKNPVSK